MISAADLQTLVAPLKSAPFAFIGAASDFMTALEQFKGSPALYVLPSSKAAGANTAGTQVVRQRVTAKFSFVIGMNKIGPLGAAVFDKLESYEESLIDALLGQQPEGVLTPIIYAGGKMLAVNVDKGILFWGSDFAADFYLRK